jgi:hypothetical protein
MCYICMNLLQEYGFVCIHEQDLGLVKVYYV